MTNALTAAPYTWTTPEYSYTFSPIDKFTIRVASHSKQAVEDFLQTVELAGTEDGTELPTTIFEDIIYQVVGDIRGDVTLYSVEVSRATVSLFLDFDVRYYMGVPTP